MICFVPFRLGHLLDLRVQPEHAPIMPQLWALGMPQLQSAMVGPWSWTAVRDERPVAACGILENGYAWALLGNDLKRDMVRVTRVVRRVLDTHRHAVGPVLAAIDETRPDAVRWAKFLGFSPTPNGDWCFDARPA